MIKKTLCALLATASPLFVTYAKTWNQQRIDQLSDQALNAVNQFIAQDPQSALNRQLSHKELTKLRQYIQSDNLSFLGVIDSVIPAIKYKGNAVSLPYFALRHSIVNNPQSGLDLYEALLKGDDTSAPYAFKQLDQLALSGNADWEEKRKQLHDYYGFSVEPSEINSEQEKPEVCLRFSKRIRPEPVQNWKQYIHIAPQPNKPLHYRGDNLCFSGLWQTRYQIDIDQALQSHNQLTLSKNTSETVSTGTRPPMIRFASDGFVLDANSERKLAISTANIDNVAVELWQLSTDTLSSDRIQSLISAPQYTNQWKLDNILRRNGHKHFAGTFRVGAYQSNETVTTNVFFDDLKINTPAKAGIYVLKAHNADTGGESAQIAFSLTNAGLSAYLTDEGLWVEMRDLQTGEPVAKQTVTFYAVDNSVLGEQVTDSVGMVKFPKSMVTGKDGLRPSHIITETNDYFGYLEVEENPVDLSDKGLSGNIDNAPLRSWLWSDRGIYRPNDTAHLMWLLKTPEGKPFNSTPIWLELLRPDGTIMHDEMVKADVSGAYTFDYHFDNASRQGNWKIKLSLGKKGAFIAEKVLPVAAIAPQQVEVSIPPIEAPVFAKQKVNVTVQADWLYGAHAADLSADLQQTIAERKLDDNRWHGWQIGLHDEKRFRNRESYDVKTTSKQGNVQFTANTDAVGFSTKPLSLKLTANVTEPSGQTVEATYSKAISRKPAYIALKDTGNKQVSAALINDNQESIAGDATWQLYRLHRDYYWYKQGSLWQYQHNESRELVKSGKVAFNANAPTAIDLPIDDGEWVVVVRGKEAETAASIPVEFGQYATAHVGSAPDRININTNKTRYADGESVTVHLSAPFDGKASVKLAHDDQLLDSKTGQYLVNFVDGKATLTFKWQKTWDNGLWLLVNAWNQAQKKVHNRRAIGLHWIGGDLAAYDIGLKIDAPELIEPNTKLSIPLSIPPAYTTGNTWGRIAVIDEGLYQLAKPSFNNPLHTFWDKKQLNIEFFDVWGDIIRQIDARQAALRSGADGEITEESAIKSLPERDIQLVTYWSAPIDFDADGKATVTLDIPQFNGRLRVMGAVWNTDRLGAAETTVAVRSPLVANLYTPAYLSPGDSSNIRIRLHNTTDKPMTIAPGFDTHGFTVKNPEGEQLTLAPDEEKWVTRAFTIPSDEKRDRVQLTIHFSGDVNNIQLNRFMDIRPKTTLKKIQHIDSIPANGQKRLDASNAEGFFERNLLLSTSAPYNINQVLQELSTYPYGCNEQITSKIWSNLYSKALQARQINDVDWGTTASQERDLFIAQSKLANRQSHNGAFSLWGNGDDDVWLTAYVTDFLLDAQAAQQLGNPQSLRRALRYLRNTVMHSHDNVEAIAYAHAVLAKAGEPVQGATMRFAEKLLHAKQHPSLSTAHLHSISALVQQGEMVLAKQLLMTIVKQGYQPNSYQSTNNYGSPLRNVAQSLYTAYQLQSQLQQLKADQSTQQTVQKIISILWQPMQEALATQQYFSTQELHWLAALATQLPNNQQAKLTVNGKPITINGSTYLKSMKNEAIMLTNNGNQPVFVTQTDWAFPKTEEIVENGYRISMRYEDVNGSPVDINKLTQNQQIVAIATIDVEKSQRNSHVMFNYPLPAGLTAESFDANNYENEGRSWYKTLGHAIFSENRDDRHIAAFNLNLADAGTFTHVFMLRASQIGTWHTPAYSVENMYQPQFRANQVMPTLVVE